jgi:uncharacterized protein YdiU (UPF0061 family)
MMQDLSSKIFENEFVRTFNGDETGHRGSRQTPRVLYSKVIPTPVSNPSLLAWSEELARELGIRKPEDPQDIGVLAGNHVTPSMVPYAACYGGHQFGNWAGQLGDGRAITLGEWKAPDGQSWELQLKGAGPTPYSRRADGRAVLRSSLREYLMSEAMFHLGVPTTRALSLVSTGDQVVRDMFYNGNPQYEPGAIVMRVAPTFLRFGNFEILAARGEDANLRKLADWTIEKFYPHIEGEDKIISWFKEVQERTINLMVEWMRVGFVHGVMNTDNMSILGLTIDYGPFSFVDNYDPLFTPNTTDLPGRRYAFARQPLIARWNLACLAGALTPLVPDKEMLWDKLEDFQEMYMEKFRAMMGKKLGLDQVRVEDISLITQAEEMLTTLQPDMTLFYQLLIDLPLAMENDQQIVDHFGDSLYAAPNPNQSKALSDFIRAYQARIITNAISREESQRTMRESNPRFILRNYLLHQAIEEMEKGGQELFLKLQQAIREPYSYNDATFLAKRPEWATQKAGCSMLSCSS